MLRGSLVSDPVLSMSLDIEKVWARDGFHVVMPRGITLILHSFQTGEEWLPLKIVSCDFPTAICGLEFSGG